MRLLMIGLALLLNGCAPPGPLPAPTAKPSTLQPGMAAVVALPDTGGTYPGAIDRATFLAIEQALTNRDNRPIDRAIRNGDTLSIPHGASVTVVSVSDGVHIEIADGPLKGRRAWVPRGILRH